MNAIHAEWTKLRTTAGPAWLLVSTVVLTVGLSAGAAATCRTADCPDPTKISLTGVQLGQAVVAVLAVLLISGEYSTEMIRTTLGATPRRGAVLGAKAIVLAVVVGAAGFVAVLGSLLLGRLILPGNEVPPPSLALTDGLTLRAAGGSVLFLVLIGLLGLGIATAVRDSAIAIGAVLALLYLFPLLAQLISDPVWQRHLRQIGPMDAGLAIQSTTGLQRLPIAPWAGLGVMAGWAAGALLLGWVLLRERDA